MKGKSNKVLSVILMTAVLLTAIPFTAYATETDASVTPAPESADADVTPAADTSQADASDANTPESYGVEVALYLMESNDEWSFGDAELTEWSEPVSESVFIDKDGTYRLSLKDLQIPADKLCLCYIKDVAAYPKDSTVTHSNVPDDIMIITDEFFVNGRKMSVDPKVRTGLKQGIFDIAYHNDWAEDDCCVNFTTDISSIDITFTVTGITGEPGAIKFEPTPTAAPAEATSDSANSTPTTNTSSNNATEESSSSTNLPLIIGIVVAAVLVVGVVVYILARKKKR